ncbi:MAG: hypothetical protein ACD_79C00422G0011 [uncultured bacterium]|nr:MAG: hypothetical protein ACD_79C00422G0011 [uncultured bacterium]
MNNSICELKIIPEKEKDRAQINLILTKSSWAELNHIYRSILNKIPAQVIINHDIFHNNTFFLEIRYLFLEEVTKTIESTINESDGIILDKRQIFIKKLGGWFDF